MKNIKKSEDKAMAVHARDSYIGRKKKRRLIKEQEDMVHVETAARIGLLAARDN